MATTLPERKPLRSKPLAKVAAHRDRRIVLQEVIRSGLTAGQAVKVIEALQATVVESLKKGALVPVRGLGTFYVRAKPGGPRRNPKNGAALVVPARKEVALRFAAAFVRDIDAANPEPSKLKRGRPIEPGAKVKR